MSRKQKFFWWKVVITIISFVIAIIGKSNIDWHKLSNNYLDFVLCKEIVYDLSVGVFSAMVLVWFVDEINEHIQDKVNKSAELDKIKRADRILQQYIDRYRLFFYCVVTPIEQRDFINVEMPAEFSFKDLRELYLTTMLISEGIFDSSIDCFVRAESKLREEIELTIREIDFEYFPQIRNCLLEFVETSLKYNQKEAWMSAKNVTVGNKKMSDQVKDLLENEADKRYEEIKTGEKEYSHNLIHTYIALYEMLKVERNIITKYEEEMEKV